VNASSVQSRVTAGEGVSLVLVRAGWQQAAVEITFITTGSAVLMTDYRIGLQAAVPADRNKSICAAANVSANVSSKPFQPCNASSAQPCSSNAFSCDCTQNCSGASKLIIL
jgi:hypothetical protein